LQLQNIRENTQGEHAEMVQQASVTVVQQRLAFLTRIKVRWFLVSFPVTVLRIVQPDILVTLFCWCVVLCVLTGVCFHLDARMYIQEKLSALHVRNQQQMKESRKLALIGNAARYQLEAANNLY